jgi:gamma-glutamylcyclotransferase (GGCT)/AIG2-like uncharacterized protein YtfP
VVANPRGPSPRAESFVPAAPTGTAVAVLRGRRAAPRSPLRCADVADHPTNLFVYGTLQPGHLRWPFLEPFVAGHRPGEVAGLLYDSGSGWPVATFGAGPDVVPGTVVELDPERADEALEVMDDVEATATDLLHRVAVTTTGGAPAWAYHCDRPDPGMARIARWASTDER